MPSLSVVVPVYNGSQTVVALIKRLAIILPAMGSDFEVILVNDASKDQSWEIICDLVQEYRWVRGVDLMRNYGQHNALLCGIRQACYETIVTLDDDLQHPPEEIPRLFEKLEEGSDVVYGTPQKEQHGFLRGCASRLTKLALQSAMGAEMARHVSAFRVFRAQVRNAFENYQSPFVSIDVLLTWGTTRFAAIPVQHDQRPVGTSNYTFRMLVTHALNMMTGYSTLPLQLASLMGFFLTVFGMGILTYVVGRWLIQGSVVPGFPFLASLIAIFSGAQLFALGIIGEYMARMHFRMMERPTYVIRQTIRPKEEK